MVLPDFTDPAQAADASLYKAAIDATAQDHENRISSILRIVMLDDPIVALSSNATNGSWNTISDATLDTNNAKVAILNVETFVSDSNDGTTGTANTYIRKKGLIGSLNSKWKANTASIAVPSAGAISSSTRTRSMFIVNLDSSYDFEWYTEHFGDVTETSINIIGYYV